MEKSQVVGTVEAVHTHAGSILSWQRWVPFATVAWSLIYAALGIYWAVSGRGFPYTPAAVSGGMGPLLGHFGPVAAWIIVVLAGLPASMLGMAMLRGVRSKVLRPLFILAGALLSGVLLLLMTGLDLLVLLGYVPYIVRSLFIGSEITQKYLQGLTQ